MLVPQGFIVEFILAPVGYSQVIAGFSDKCCLMCKVFTFPFSGKFPRIFPCQMESTPVTKVGWGW